MHGQPKSACPISECFLVPKSATADLGAVALRGSLRGHLSDGKTGDERFNKNNRA
jgi:hypothetical protein